MSWWINSDTGARYRVDEYREERPPLQPPPQPPAEPTTATIELPELPPLEAAEPMPDVPAHAIVAFARDVLHFELTAWQAAILSDLYGSAIRTGVIRAGRRGGKGRLSAVVAAYEATVGAEAHLAAVPAGERVVVAVVATAQHQARIVHRYVRSFLQAPALERLIVRDTEDEIELSNGVSIITIPCSARSARGMAVAVLIMDEAAWFVTSDGSPQAAEEIWQALTPSTAQFPAGKVLVLSTPRWSTGWFADLCRQAASGEHPAMRTWHASTAAMNPGIPAEFLAQEQAKDPPVFRREYLAEFESGVGAVFEDAAVRAAVESRGALAPYPGVPYTVAIDPAFTGDVFSLLVGHRDGEQLVVDRVNGWQGSRGRPLSHRRVLDEVAEIATAYNRAPVLLDQYAAEPIAEGLVERGISPVRKPWRNALKVAAVTATRQALYAGQLRLPRHAALTSQLVSLEQRPLPSGQPRIAAPPGQHDDFASALLALVHELSSGTYSGSLVGSN